MTYLFFVQGEGRGHLMQALTLKIKLENRGHKILGVVIGQNEKNKIPDFLKAAWDIPLFFMASPSFVVDKKGQGINIPRTISAAFFSLPAYFKSFQKIKKLVADLQPEILINFYEPLAGNYYRFSGDQRPMFCVGHQYFADHPACQFPAGQPINRWLFKFYNRLVAPSRSHKIALSFTPEEDLPNKKILVCPPLIRPVIKKQTTRSGEFVLLYILNDGYSEEIISWSKNHPTVKIEAFWNRPGPEITSFGDNLTFHRLDGNKFIERLAACRAYVSTAGFDSIAEAAYLQKPILMIPTANHFEQKCNAVDARRAGLALTAEHFDLTPILDEQQNLRTHGALGAFKKWVDDQENKIINILEK